MVNYICLAVIFVVSLTACSLRPEPPEADFAILQVNVVDVESRKIDENQTVLVRNGTITAVAPFDSTIIADRAQTVFAAGQFLVPGRPGSDNFTAVEPGNVAEFILRDNNPLMEGPVTLVGAFFDGRWWDKDSLEFTFEQRPDAK
jgi:hypothetical protein